VPRIKYPVKYWPETVSLWATHRTTSFFHRQKCKSTIDCAVRCTVYSHLCVGQWIYIWPAVDKPQPVFTADRLRCYCTHSLSAFLSGRLRTRQRACLGACLGEPRFGWSSVFPGKLWADGKLWICRSFGQWKAIPLPVTGFGPIDGPAFKIHITQPQSSQMPPK